MPVCPRCGDASPDQSRFCASCGAAFDTSRPPRPVDDETRLIGTAAGGTRSRTSVTQRFATPGAEFDHGRFVPGATLADRYRIIGRVGRGGMGEIYRADDLRLGQQVALKFLPDDVVGDAARLAQFHAEVRLARQVSHPNVCRVYDIDEDGGYPFLSMEYIDGEDLASLLRRIGRLPQDKALELSRQLCAGLAAAHERGVIHRDLKPANLMIDGEGRLRITDFGIAGLTGGGGPVAGTPGYMAPELLAGVPASIRSDIYALGLVLYELFTGKKAYAQRSLAEIVRAQHETQPDLPTAFVKDLDPAIEHTILRCLQRDPALRPSSALAVSAMLPGGDPLAAALAAGETPSPEMIAAAGEAEALSPARGLILFSLSIVGLLAALFLADRTVLVNLIALEKPPEVLADRAREILRRSGYTSVVDQGSGFAFTNDYLRYVRERNASPARWKDLPTSRGPHLTYWVRTSPRLLVPMGVSAALGLHDPPMNVTGQAGLIVDQRGRLIELHGVAPQFDEQNGNAASPPWDALFEAAELDKSRFTPASPAWTPRGYADTRAAWTGTVLEHPGVTFRVEAASYRGAPVYFSLVGPWTQPTRMLERPQSRAEKAFSTIATVIITLLLLGAALLAWRNVRRRRGDRVAASSVAGVVCGLSFASYVLRAKHVADLGTELERLFLGVALSLLSGALLWVFYLAVEPSVRRFWPDSLLGWSRLISGRVRDARVGRELLAGSVIGIGIALLSYLHSYVPVLLGYAADIPSSPGVQMLNGTATALAYMLRYGENALNNAVLGMFALVLLRMVVRSRTLAAVLATLVFSLVVMGENAATRHPVIDGLFVTGIVGGIIATMVRFGLLATMAAFFAVFAIGNTPLTSSLTEWYGTPATFALAAVLALAASGFYLSRGGAPLFGRALHDE